MHVRSSWILFSHVVKTQVEPPQGSPIPTSTDERVYSWDLHEELTTHHDTRFLAALIFVVFFFSVPERQGDECARVADDSDVNQKEEPDNSRKLVVWDYAVAAIALAVKV